MRNTGIQLLFVSVILTTFMYCHGQTRTNAETVYSTIFTSYNADIRPVLDQTQVVMVNITFTLIAINSFDEVSGVISAPGMFTLTWIDDRLAWDISTKGYLGVLKFPQSKIWLPKIYLLNPSKNYKAISDDDYILTLTYEGKIYWNTGGVIQWTCSPDITYFPFDQQNCTMTIVAAGYSSTEVQLTANSVVDMTYYQTNGEWELVKSTGHDIAVPGDFGMSFAKFDVIIKRRPMYFFVSILLPVVFLLFLNPLVYVLPVDSGERMSFCLTVLLSFAVFMTLVDDVMPKSSEPSMALVSYYILGSIIISALTTIINVFIIAAYHKQDEKKVPSLIQCVVAACCCRNKNVIKPDNSLDISNNVKRLNLSTEDENKHEHSENSDDENTVTWKSVASCVDCFLFISNYVLTIVSTVVFIVILIRGSP